MTDHRKIAEEVRTHICEALSHNPKDNVYIYVIQDEETVLDFEESWGIYPDYTITADGKPSFDPLPTR